MGIVDKYDLRRLDKSNLELAFDCPNCKKTRISMNGNGDTEFWNEVECPKCNSQIVLDGFSLAVIKNNGNLLDKF